MSKKRLGGRILQVAEMLNSEGKAVKEASLQQFKSAKIKIRLWAHDCSCCLKGDFESKGLAKKCVLDKWHALKHKCDCEDVQDPKLNSEAAEQLWSRVDKFQWVSTMSRAHYRYLLKHYASWRNSFLGNGKRRADVCPIISGKRRRM